MTLDTEWSRGNPEHMLFLDPFKEPLRYFVVELGHSARILWASSHGMTRVH